VAVPNGSVDDLALAVDGDELDPRGAVDRRWIAFDRRR
jgi:hypothetical protein